MRKAFVAFSICIIAAQVFFYIYWPYGLFSLVIFVPILVAGYIDFFQVKRAIRRNFPILGNFRYLFEMIRPEINQYFVESNSDGVPFSREERSVIYQRAKKQLDTLPFGTQKDVYSAGYEWLNHSLQATHLDKAKLRVLVGGPDCQKPYSASLLNISAMSFGALSSNAVLALNGGARDGMFAHNTGEGGLSHYHMKNGGDLIWQIGTGYFSARTPDGRFSEEEYQKKSQLEIVKMIELKLSQGAKPGHGGLLPAAKITKEISEIRGVPMNQDVNSPPNHKEFSTPIGMMEFIKKLRDLSGGKPIGIKLCLGKRREFLALCKAMIETGYMPDYIDVDGGEGGTGAAPLEFSNNMGTPGIDGLVFVQNALLGFGLRDKIKVFSSGKVTTGFGIIKRLALGSDAIYSARAFMMALGCIQALRCNSNHCPTGVATQDPNLTVGLVESDKRVRVKNYHSETLASVAELVGAMGLSATSELRPWHVMRRLSQTEIRHYGELYTFVEPGSFLHNQVPAQFARALKAARPDSFQASV